MQNALDELNRLSVLDRVCWLVLYVLCGISIVVLAAVSRESHDSSRDTILIYFCIFFGEDRDIKSDIML